MALYHSGKDGKRILRNNFPHHMLMSNLKTDNKFLHPIEERKYWESITEEQRLFYIKKAEEHEDFVWRTIPVMETYYSTFHEENRTRHDTLIFEKKEALLWLTVGECIENKGRFIHKIVDGIFSVCEQTTWAVSSHFMQCGLSKEELPDDEDAVLDLSSINQAACLSITYVLLKNQLNEISPVICRRIEKEIEKRIITPFLTRDDLWWMCKDLDLTFWSVNNWTTFCCHYILFTALSMNMSKKIVYQVVNKVIDCLDVFVDAYPDDGACDEGPSYWGGAIPDLISALELLEHVICGKTDIWKNEKLKKMCEYILHMRIHETQYACIADAHPHSHPQLSFILNIYQQGKLFENTDMIQEAVYLYDFLPEVVRSPMCFVKEFSIWNDFIQTPKSDFQGIRSCWMGDTQILSTHECSDTSKGMYLCVKGGNNHESHNHNDVGSFIVYKNGRPIIVDAGVGTYGNTTFGEYRYTNWWANGFYHNIPIVGGAEQVIGADFKATDVKCHCSDAHDSIALELKHAYRNSDNIKTLKRTATLDREKNCITIEDTYSFENPMDYESTLLLQHKPELVGDVFICGEAKIAISGVAYQTDVEEIDLTYDPVFVKAWGEKLYKFSVKIEPKTEGTLRITVE